MSDNRGVVAAPGSENRLKFKRVKDSRWLFVPHDKMPTGRWQGIRSAAETCLLVGVLVGVFGVKTRHSVSFIGRVVQLAETLASKARGLRVRISPLLLGVNMSLLEFLREHKIVKTIAEIQGYEFHGCMKINGEEHFNPFMELSPGDQIEIRKPKGNNFLDREIIELTYMPT